MTRYQEDGWMLSEQPRAFAVSNPEAAFAVVIVVAGDSDLANQVGKDLEEMRDGACVEVSVLVLVDRPGDQGLVAAEITSEGLSVVASWPERSTGDPQLLAEFWARSLASYSSETRLALGFWGHGQGAFGDGDTREVLLPEALLKKPLEERARRSRSSRDDDDFSSAGMLPDLSDVDGVLTNREARSAFGAAFVRAGRSEPVDLIFSDTCLNGSIEVFAELRDFARVVVASSLPIPAKGWDYKLWLSATGKERPADAEGWARLAVEAFELAHPQLGKGFPLAQLAAFSTERGDLVKAFAGVVKALREATETRRLLVGLAVSKVQAVHYRENLDLEQLVLRLLELAEEGSSLKAACRKFGEVFRETSVALSAAPEGGEELSGLTIWCPVKGDLEKVSEYYPRLTFERKTKWLKLLTELERDKASI